jgi:hypothetical protein
MTLVIPNGVHTEKNSNLATTRGEVTVLVATRTTIVEIIPAYLHTALFQNRKKFLAL